MIDSVLIKRLARSIVKRAEEAKEDKVEVVNRDTGRKVWVSPETLKGKDSAKYEPIKDDDKGKGDKGKGEKGTVDVGKALKGPNAKLKGDESKRLSDALDDAVGDHNDKSLSEEESHATFDLSNAIFKAFDGHSKPPHYGAKPKPHYLEPLKKALEDHLKEYPKDTERVEKVVAAFKKFKAGYSHSRGHGKALKKVKDSVDDAGIKSGTPTRDEWFDWSTSHKPSPEGQKMRDAVSKLYNDKSLSDDDLHEATKQAEKDMDAAKKAAERAPYGWDKLSDEDKKLKTELWVANHKAKAAHRILSGANYFRQEGELPDWGDKGKKDDKKKASAERVALTHASYRVASRVRTAAPSKSLQVEAEYWGKLLSSKRRASFKVQPQSSGVVMVRFNESYEEGSISYAIYGQDVRGEIKWSSEARSRKLSQNDPREIEKVFNRSRNAAIALYVENDRGWAQEVAYRYATAKESGK